MPPSTATHPASPSPTPGTAECRVWPRQACEVPATCQPVAARHAKASAWKATIRDVSRVGLGLLLARRFEPGTVLFVELSLRDGEERRPLLARVVRAARQTEGGW